MAQQMLVEIERITRMAGDHSWHVAGDVLFTIGGSGEGELPRRLTVEVEIALDEQASLQAVEHARLDQAVLTLRTLGGLSDREFRQAYHRHQQAMGPPQG